MDKLDQIRSRCEFIEARLNAGASVADLASLSREYAELKPVVERIDAFRDLLAEQEEARRLLADPEMRGLGMEDGFRDDALNYLLVLRLIPLFPFWIVNLVPAFLGVPQRTYVLGTLIGIIPGSFVFASVGAGLGSVLDSGQEFSPSSVLTPQIVIALVGLAVLALLPVAYRKWRARRG
jgi:hypothetical protein